MLLSTPLKQITSERLLFRSLTELDATERYVGWLTDPVVNAYLTTRSATADSVRRYIVEKNNSPTALLLGIVWKESGELIGTVKLEPIDQRLGIATFAMMIGEKDFWGKGVATEVTKTMTELAFSQLGLREVQLGVLGENKAAIRAYEKAGFSTYRIEEQARDHGGVCYDQVWMRRVAPPRV